MNHIEKRPPSFDDFGIDNGERHWKASVLMRLLDYANMQSFEKVIDRATQAMIALGGAVKHHNEIQHLQGQDDYRLTRFACYMIAMNADVRKPQVARAQAYFATMARNMELHIENQHSQIERVSKRQVLVDKNKSLSSTAKQAGVDNYANFQNAGYLGLYNQSTWSLANRRGIEKKDLLEYMGNAELAANIFRVAMTDERLRKDKIKGQRHAEETHLKVGEQVRAMVKENTGEFPEDLPTERLLPRVKSEFKRLKTKMSKKDKKKPSA